MNISPLLHKCLSMAERVETAISGYLCLDLFQVLASELCSKRSLPTGSMFLAQQTMRDLQACSLAAIVIGLTKGPDLEPWRRGFGRLSELAIEQLFGQLRSQSGNSQLTCRGYWQANARNAIKLTKNLHREEPLVGNEAPLSEEELLDLKGGVL